MVAVYDKDKHIAELETINSALVDKLSYLTKRKQARNNEAANKWRRSAIYFRQRCQQLVGFIKQQGLEVPPYESSNRRQEEPRLQENG